MKINKQNFILFYSVVIAVFIYGSIYAQEAKQPVLSLLIDEALENNPQIKSVFNEWKAAEYKVKQVKSLPDPMASYTYFGESVETRVGPQKAKYGGALKVPFPGKLGIKGKVQSQNAQILKEKYEAGKRELIKNIKFVYYDIFWIDKSIQIIKEEKAILESLEQVAQRKYESDLSSQQDVLKAQVELSKLIDRLFILEQARTALVAKMNSLLNRPENREFAKIERIDLEEFNYHLAQLHKMASLFRQELLAADLAIQKAKYEKSLANLDYLPDFTFGFDYIRVPSGRTMALEDGKDAWMSTVAINIPIWFDKLSSQVKEKKSLVEASKKNYENVENNIAFEVEDVYSKILTYKDIIGLYKTALIPQTEQAFEAAKIAYETQKVDFLNWLDSERVLLQTRLAYYKAMVDYQKSIAYLERVIGRDMETAKQAEEENKIS